MAKRLEHTPVTYLVIDAGWYLGKNDSEDWHGGIGDWRVNKKRFPDGLGATAEAIREHGLVPDMPPSAEVTSYV